ncbi:MAG: hypothetical protein QOF76_5311 [Solirubrobacteraceae bacterium]|nr:hypothetical protein [Solirubrobacteraceae bacterium]
MPHTSDHDRTRAQLACAAVGFVVPVIALVGLFGSGIMPPKPAHSSAAEVAAFYSEHHGLRIAGLLVGFMAIGGMGPLITVISLHLRRAERGGPPLGSTMQLVAGGVTWVFLSIPLLILLVAAFRANRDPELTQTLHDLGWILFLIPIAPFMVQNFAIAYVIFTDPGPEPIYPRWLGYANVFIALSFVPDLLLGFFKSGAFAYQGVFAFWIPTVTYGVWLNLMGLLTWVAIKRAGAPENI